MGAFEVMRPGGACRILLQTHTHRAHRERALRERLLSQALLTLLNFKHQAPPRHKSRPVCQRCQSLNDVTSCCLEVHRGMSQLWQDCIELVAEMCLRAVFACRNCLEELPGTPHHIRVIEQGRFCSPWACLLGSWHLPLQLCPQGLPQSLNFCPSTLVDASWRQVHATMQSSKGACCRKTKPPEAMLRLIELARGQNEGNVARGQAGDPFGIAPPGSLTSSDVCRNCKAGHTLELILLEWLHVAYEPNSVLPLEVCFTAKRRTLRIGAVDWFKPLPSEKVRVVNVNGSVTPTMRWPVSLEIPHVLLVLGEQVELCWQPQRTHQLRC
mmetsp:Transcript_102852/g.182725  ORF Transcript_102852/g.182725 Transcript_102852/m.182725 type:complete len:326 (+) Transcript_102852:263-1240(+)